MKIIKPDKLWKTTIEIWTDFDPNFLEIDDLTREAMSGDAFCNGQVTVEITDPALFPNTDFFGHEEDEE